MTGCRVPGWMPPFAWVGLAGTLYPPSGSEELTAGLSSLAGGFWVVTRWDPELRAAPSFTHRREALLRAAGPVATAE